MSTAEETTDPLERLESLLEEYLLERADGATVDLGDYLGRLADPERESDFRREALALDYLGQLAGGREVELDEYLGQLRSAAEREGFMRMLREGHLAGRLLPGRVGPGAVLERRYLVRREIGHGGMGVVWAAFDLELERDVAIKVFNRDASAGTAENWDEIILRESKSLAALKSRHIVTVYDARRAVPESFIVMDLVGGPDLRNVLRDLRKRDRTAGGMTHAARAAALAELVGRADEKERAQLVDGRRWFKSVAAMMHAIVSTVEQAHARGVIHRDLKPGNILVVGGGEPVLLDFGLAASQDPLDLHDEEGLRGTPEYVAPEQIERMRTGTDPQSDVYQLGLILYELLTLKRAFRKARNESMIAFLERVRAGKIEAPREIDGKVPPALDAICRKAYAAHAEDRYASAEQMRVDLERWLRGLPPRFARVDAGHAAALRARYVVRQPLTIMALLAALILWFVLRPDPWVPPQMEVVYQQAGGDPVVLELGEQIPVSASDEPEFLYIRANAEDPAWMYVFSVFKVAGDDREYVRPLPAERIGGPAAGGEPRAVELETGANLVACATIDRASSSEGLLAFVCEEPQPALADWQMQLYEDEVIRLGDPWTLERAYALGKRLIGGARGGSLAQLSPEDREKIKALLNSDGAEQDVWHEAGIDRELWRFDLQR